MGIIAILIGIVFGWNLSEWIHPSNWGTKILYSICPIIFTVLLALFIGIGICRDPMAQYKIGGISAIVLFGCIAYAIVALFKIKIVKDENSIDEDSKSKKSFTWIWLIVLLIGAAIGVNACNKFQEEKEREALKEVLKDDPELLNEILKYE